MLRVQELSPSQQDEVGNLLLELPYDFFSGDPSNVEEDRAMVVESIVTGKRLVISENRKSIRQPQLNRWLKEAQWIKEERWIRPTVEVLRALEPDVCDDVIYIWALGACAVESSDGTSYLKYRKKHENPTIWHIYACYSSIFPPERAYSVLRRTLLGLASRPPLLRIPFPHDNPGGGRVPEAYREDGLSPCGRRQDPGLQGRAAGSSGTAGSKGGSSGSPPSGRVGRRIVPGSNADVRSPGRLNWSAWYGMRMTVECDAFPKVRR